MKNTILIILLTAIFSAFCFTSCKNTEKDEPNGVDGDPIDSFLPWEIEEITGFIVVKFADEQYKDYIPARAFSGTNEDGYYIPMCSWATPNISYFDKNEKYHPLGNGYFAVDWSLVNTSALFSYYMNWDRYFRFWPSDDNETRDINKLIEKKNQIQNDKDSPFVKDMQEMKLTKLRWDDNSFSSLAELPIFKEDDAAINNNVSTPIFEYFQFVFIKDVMQASGKDIAFPDEMTNILFEDRELSAVVPVVGTSYYYFAALHNSNLWKHYRNVYEGTATDYPYPIWDFTKYAYEKNKIQTILLPILSDIVEKNSDILPPSLL